MVFISWYIAYYVVLLSVIPRSTHSIYLIFEKREILDVFVEPNFL